MDKLTIVIPAAGLGRRMKSYGSKSLIDLHGNLLLLRQLAILRKLYPQALFTVVLGFDADKIIRVLPPYVSVVENKFYHETNVAKSLSLGLVKAEHALIVYGDLVFNEATLKELPLVESSILINSDNQIKDCEVGLTVVNGYVSRFSYGLPIKWAQIAYLTNRELALFKEAAALPQHRKHFGFEILNMVLDNGGKLKAVEPSGMKIQEIDSSKDIELARKLVKEDK